MVNMHRLVREASTVVLPRQIPQTRRRILLDLLHSRINYSSMVPYSLRLVQRTSPAWSEGLSAEKALGNQWGRLPGIPWSDNACWLDVVIHILGIAIRVPNIWPRQMLTPTLSAGSVPIETSSSSNWFTALLDLLREQNSLVDSWLAKDDSDDLSDTELLGKLKRQRVELHHGWIDSGALKGYRFGELGLPFVSFDDLLRLSQLMTVICRPLPLQSVLSTISTSSPRALQNLFSTVKVIKRVCRSKSGAITHISYIEMHDTLIELSDQLKFKGDLQRFIYDQFSSGKTVIRSCEFCEQNRDELCECRETEMLIQAPRLLILQAPQIMDANGESHESWAAPLSLNVPFSSVQYHRLGMILQKDSHFTAVSRFPGASYLCRYDDNGPRRGWVAIERLSDKIEMEKQFGRGSPAAFASVYALVDEITGPTQDDQADLVQTRLNIFSKEYDTLFDFSPTSSLSFAPKPASEGYRQLSLDEQASLGQARDRPKRRQYDFLPVVVPPIPAPSPLHNPDEAKTQSAIGELPPQPQSSPTSALPDSRPKPPAFNRKRKVAIKPFPIVRAPKSPSTEETSKRALVAQQELMARAKELALPDSDESDLPSPSELLKPRPLTQLSFPPIPTPTVPVRRSQRTILARPTFTSQTNPFDEDEPSNDEDGPSSGEPFVPPRSPVRKKIRTKNTSPIKATKARRAQGSLTRGKGRAASSRRGRPKKFPVPVPEERVVSSQAEVDQSLGIGSESESGKTLSASELPSVNQHELHSRSGP